MNESTFRLLFRKAIGEASYPAGLSNRVDALVNARGDGRSLRIRIRSPWLAGVGRMGSLAAALLVLLLLATLVVGVRVWRDRNLFNAGPSAAATNQAEIAQLAARPLILPVVPAGGACPATYHGSVDIGIPAYNLFTFFGDGPVYGIARAAGGESTTNISDYHDLTLIAEPQVTSLILVRIYDLRTGQAGFFVGSYVAGKVVGTDTIGGKTVQHRVELVLDASRPPTSSPNKFGMWDVRQGFPTGWSGCYGMQVDGAGFSEVLVHGT
jgi:hypothetical protein